MTAILDALAPYVNKMIMNMAEEEMSLLLGVSRKIKELEGNMESIKDFLADAERRCISDKCVQRWVRKLKNAMYDATDILDLCQLKFYDRYYRGESKGESVEEKAPGNNCFQELLFCLRDPMFVHSIGRRIKKLNQQLDAIHKEADKFKFDINIGSNQETSRKPTSEYNELAIVGKRIEEDTKELVQVLTTQDNPDIKVVSIVGMGGMGKTTLAQKIFKEKTIEEHFKMKVWLSITQHFDEVDLLRTAISHAGGNHNGDQDKSLLTRTLTETLSTGRFLLVLDDVWSENAWNNVLSIPILNASHKQQGNRVLVTTRLENLVPQMKASFHQHHVSQLDEEDAWTLLKKQLPLQSNKTVSIEHLKHVGSRIIEKCGGLPLAIKVMGGLLSTRYPSEREWEAVLNSSAWSMAGLPRELDNRVYLSYEDLSPQLKQCFLYCSLFPKGTNIRQCEIIPMWISEGFIEPCDGRGDMEEVATEYYRELITRNLIEPKESYYLTGYKCTMHDVVRSFAEFMAREESLVLHKDEKIITASGNKDTVVRRLSIGPNKSVVDSAILKEKQTLRTLIINCKIDFEPSDLFSHFSSLRSLLIKDADCDRLINSLSQLRHLRYLHLEDTNISRLPNNIHRMKFLQHIVLDGSKNLSHLPSCIIQLVHLRTLDMNGSNVSVVPKGFGGLTNLRTLYGFPVHMDNDGGSWCSLEEITPLSQLRDLTLQGLENLPTSSLAKKAMISSKEHLSYLRFNCITSKSMGSVVEIEKQELRRAIEEVFDELCPPTRIEDLAIKGGYFGNRLPEWMTAPATSAFKSLRYLTLMHLHCCTQLPDGLCQLPALESLDIEDAPAIKSVGPEFQAHFSTTVGGGAASATASAAFPYMTNLCLEGLCNWEEWDWKEQGEDMTSDIIAMPALVTLTINNCQLQCLPRGLANSKRLALRRLELYKIINLTVVENFSSVVKFYVFDCPKLKRISCFSRLQSVKIVRCLKLEVLEDVPKLDSLELEDTSMARLPDYLRAVKPRYLKLECSKKLSESLLPGSSEWDKISHIEKYNICYIDDWDED